MTSRRRLVVISLLGTWGLGPPAGAASRPVRCPDGRFVQAAAIVGGSAAGAFDAVVLEAGYVSIASGCEPARARVRATQAGTRVRARWRRCGELRHVRLAGTIIEDGEPCQRLFGTLRARGQAGSPVSATRSRCGDGIVDTGRGEACDPPGTGCGAQCEVTGPIAAPAEQWTWVPFAGAQCANGSATGIGVNLTSRGTRVLVFLMGGGACWDEVTCYQLGTAANVSTGYGAPQFAVDAQGFARTPLFDRGDPANPFRDDSYVVVPYCTGDVHAGSNPNALYGGRLTRHVGYRNLAAYLTRLVPTFAGASRVVLSGSSAGGYGALTNWWQVQQAFGTVRVDLIDDSGPPLPAPYLAENLEQTWRAAWNLAAAIPPGCTKCATDLDAIIPFYAAALPGRRAALLSYVEDGTISFFFGISGAQTRAGLDVLAAAIDPLAGFRYFYAAGASHVLLRTPDLAQNGVTLRAFLTQMVSDDPAWESVGP
jgi:hypothetical protein